MRRLFDCVFNGSDQMYEKARKDLDAAIKKYGPDHSVMLPDTAFNCAIILEYAGVEIKTLADLDTAMNGTIK